MISEKTPIHLKLLLTIEEASDYTNIGQNAISKMLKDARCPFVLYVGNKKLLKRREFEDYISKIQEI